MRSRPASSGPTMHVVASCAGDLDPDDGHCAKRSLQARRRSRRPRRRARRRRCGRGYGPRHRSAGARSARRASVAARSPLRSSGRVSRRAGALGQHLDRSIEPDGDRALVEQLAGARIDEGAAAGGDDPDARRRPAARPAAARRRGNLLAVALEHFGGRRAPAASSIACRCRRTAGRAAWPGGGRRSTCPRPSARPARWAGRGVVGQLFHDWAGLYRRAVRSGKSRRRPLRSQAE